MNNIKRFIGVIPICGWHALGFNRGMNSYDYNHSNDRIYKRSTRPLYIDKVCWGFCGVVCYLLPPLCFIAAYKEVYRLEVNIRGLEDEKKTCYYNELLG